MSITEFSDVVISDSEDDGAQSTNILFNITEDLDVDTSSVENGDTDATEEANVTQTSHTVNDGNVPLMKANYEAGELPTYAGSRWSLRKRKAIQKMPYSLERIKHRQLLEGFDVSSFDFVSNQVNLPDRIYTAANDAAPVTEATLNGDLQWETADEQSSSSFEEGQKLHDTETLPEYRRSSSIRQHEVTEQASGESDQNLTSEDEVELNEVVFRGRKINVKTGYRGILPKMAWKRELKRGKSKNSGQSLRNHEVTGKKGIAVRKTVKTVLTNQDDDLMNDIVADGNYNSSIEYDPADFYLKRDQKDYLHDNDTINEVNRYYQDKYNDKYLLLDSSDEEVLEVQPVIATNKGSVNDEAGLSLMHSRTKNALSDLVEIMSDDNLLEAPESDRQTYLIESGEYNRGEIDPGLAHRKTRNKRRHNNGRTSTIDNYFHTKDRPIRLTKISIRNTSNKPRITRYTPQTVHRKASRTSEGEINSRKGQSLGLNFSKKSSDENTKKIKSKRRSDMTIKNPIFTTVVEALGDKIITMHQKASKVSSEFDHIPEDKITYVDYKLPALEAFYSNNAIDPPNLSRILISGKSYTLSRFNSLETINTINQIYDAIIEVGASEKELIDSCKTMSTFILHLNLPTLYEATAEFHKKFYIKVNKMRKKTKSIFFYELSSCQWLLLQISKFTNISNSKKLHIETEILHNIVHFFKALSRFDEDALQKDDECFFESYNILATVVDILGKKDDLWDLLEEQKFSPQLSFIICNIFPTKQERWGILEVKEKYTDFVQSFRFTKYCISSCHWPITDDILLLYDRIFKKRRFNDFPEEHVFSKRNYVVSSLEASIPNGTMFNKYLTLLTVSNISQSMLERLIPISDISKEDTAPTLINRMNLILILASRSNTNLEKRFEKIANELLTVSYAKSHELKNQKRLYEAFLNGIIFLLENNSSKNLPLRVRYLSLIYKNFIHNKPEIELVWSDFLKKLSGSLLLAKKHRVNILRDLYPNLVLMVQRDTVDKDAFMLMGMYIKYLDAFKAAWIQNSLLPLIKNKANTSIDWVHYYCIIGKCLVMKDATTWWSFYTYNGLEDNLSIKIFFNYKVVLLCDGYSFDLIKKSVFSFISSLYFQESSTNYMKLLQASLKRENGNVEGSISCENKLGSLFFLKLLFSCFHKLKYFDVMIQFVDNIQACYESEKLNQEFVEETIQYLNSRYVDQLKDCYSFSLLTRKFGISDIEREKSIFRDRIEVMKDNGVRVLYIFQNLNAVCSNEEQLQSYHLKVTSLFYGSNFKNPMSLFSDIIKGMIGVTNPSFRKYTEAYLAYFLILINNYISAEFSLLTPRDFLTICRLHKILCQNLSSDSTIQGGNYILKKACLTFQLQALRISNGFWEHEKLLKLTRDYCLFTKKSTNVPLPELSAQIEQIWTKNGCAGVDNLTKLYSYDDLTVAKLTEKLSAYTGLT
ncbi:hypothetical protein KAFR_0A06630 [Kazachstania africana CBS 2517]|uniref:Uncharacterized protein n=1 Tax=Kazachstania africana (strain ATCC 22294 / BCRC 22015 / CBS 2517 / CECT 1963 / NBRC 1671 / NRRL Y-8276) TaxID=1071382 RepID=H2ANZ8_KAZAF|nr:hypothetical protein KAFR_0A06630 [Kazachstania africana CBS 2517]CCF56098.1 hypothetical protein KAFR_0A06630 [Kazachstania africana CBS 2517]